MTTDSYPDLVLHGQVLTMSNRSDVTTVVVRDGRISDLGDDSLLHHHVGLGADITEIEGILLPGFVDPHTHFSQYAAARATAIDCRVPLVRTISDVLDALRDGLRAQRFCGPWLVGYGNLFFDQKLAERRLPTREELDRVSTRHPIVVHCGGHVSVLNTAALERVRVERFIGSTEGLWGRPVIDVDKSGRPTGLVAEIDRHLGIPEPDHDELVEAFATTYRTEFLRYGVTTIGEMLESEHYLDALSAASTDGSVPARFGLYAMAPSFAPHERSLSWVREAILPGRLTACGTKVFADGGYSARNAASNAPYSADHAPYAGYRGKLNLERPALVAAVEDTQAAGVQLAIHTNGTRAQQEALDAVAMVGGVRRGGVRIEHLGNVLDDPSTIRRWRDTGVLPVMQPGFLRNFIADFVPMLFPATGTRGRMPLRTILDEGIWPAFSSDVAVGGEIGASNPLSTIAASVDRLGYWDRPVEPHEAISVGEALRCHSLAAAEALGMTGEVGTIDIGARADMVVLDRDPRTVDIETIRDVGVRQVWIDGVLEYEAAPV
ncbi:amidohydrolase [Rhodococcus pyridinivorans]|uniref:amidohydrolase n=1 Tax=Rhodococcus pyridinivorans TaxID=103816 RepID=UPI002283A5D7|nr:amidohydrolase family protein [Rhodococcus pyridinivorans]WAL49501.1 amidohydrolase family protein [Rhodococcus pyridinivorans]